MPYPIAIRLAAPRLEGTGRWLPKSPGPFPFPLLCGIIAHSGANCKGGHNRLLDDLADAFHITINWAAAGYEARSPSLGCFVLQKAQRSD